MNRLDGPTFDRVNLFDIQSYLLRNGWKRLASKNGRWEIYRLSRETEPNLEVVLPASEHFFDTHKRIAEVIRSITQLEDRSEADVYLDLLSLNADSLLIRLQVPRHAATLPIADASRHVRAIKNLLLYAGCSELEPRPHFEQPLPASQNLLGAFEFCHTFRGSFGFEVTSAVSKSKETPDFFSSPINRRIVERIARGLVMLESSVRKDNPGELIESYDVAFNARMCDALFDIGLGGDISFDLEVKWAVSVTPCEDASAFHGMFFGEAQTSMLKFVAEQLKIVKPQLERISGRVVNLHCATNPGEGNARRTVAIKVQHEKYGLIEVRIALGPQFYLMAIEAHSKGKELTATGQLQRRGNTWSLEAIASIEIKSV
ncbi:hypothetical protein [Thiocystis violascens]|uniref:Uncharacterized protein n=1 Tax=Thiocystis violascens (strain ATCC 17096 / DSM 198 / 6111) TaxID=765911 RepID=I3Y8V9_THIV6|nr:hypothetical protein [Thiocystis violascens]AFL73427.1 hypothetical protein Thivi_1420 [Thiocystis violascens DSM 198]